jgi:hypothetical protein
MSWYVAYATDAGDQGDAEDVATNSGWTAFTSWALSKLPRDDFRELRYLSYYGEADQPQQLQEELRRLLADKPADPEPDTLHVAQRLLALLRGLPADTAAIQVTDGSPPGGDEGDDDEGDHAPRRPRVGPSQRGKSLGPPRPRLTPSRHRWASKGIARTYSQTADPQAGGYYLASEVAASYDFPQHLIGQGATVGVVMLGGAFSQEDFNAFCKLEDIRPPQVEVISADGTEPSPDPGRADLEVQTGTQIIAGAAPGARIRIFHAANSEPGFLAAVKRARQDKVDALAITWGNAENTWSPAFRAAMNAELRACARQGISTFAASGDLGAGDGQRAPTTDYPAASPYVTAVGGTRMLARGDRLEEEAWNSTDGATGGGQSRTQPRPRYQEELAIPGSGRLVPDIAANADTATGFLVISGGQHLVVGGTSAAAPLYAALAARFVEAGRPLGFANAWLYAAPRSVFNPVRGGDNGAYAATPHGYNLAVGWGSLNGEALLEALQKLPSKPAAAARNTSEGSYFGHCPRDEQGHCKPSGSGQQPTLTKPHRREQKRQQAYQEALDAFDQRKADREQRMDAADALVNDNPWEGHDRQLNTLDPEAGWDKEDSPVRQRWKTEEGAKAFRDQAEKWGQASAEVFAQLHQDRLDRLRDIGGSDKLLAKAGDLVGKGKAAIQKAAGKYLPNIDKAQKLQAQLDEHEADEPPEPDQPDPDAPEAEHDAYEKALARWEADSEKWQDRKDDLEGKVDAANDAEAEAKEAIDTAVNAWSDKVSDVVEKGAGQLHEDLTEEEDSDHEPEPPDSDEAEPEVKAAHQAIEKGLDTVADQVETDDEQEAYDQLGNAWNSLGDDPGYDHVALRDYLRAASDAIQVFAQAGKADAARTIRATAAEALRALRAIDAEGPTAPAGKSLGKALRLPHVVPSPYRDEWKSFTGEKRDRLGRRRCWEEGKPAPCNRQPDEQADKPTKDKPSGHKPTSGKPTADKPVAEQPGGHKPTGAQGDQQGKRSAAKVAQQVITRLGGMGLKAARALWNAPDTAEHFISEYAKTNFYRMFPEQGPDFVGPHKEPGKLAKTAAGAWWLTKKALTVAYAPWIAGEALAHKVALEKGASPEEADHLQHLLLMNDAKLFKVSLALAEHTGLATGGVTLAMSLVPMASSAYLAYSTATDPGAVYRAAHKAVGDAWAALRGRKDFDQADAVQLCLDGMRAYGSDRFMALLSVAWDYTHDLAQAAQLAQQAAQQDQGGQQGKALPNPKPDEDTMDTDDLASQAEDQERQLKSLANTLTKALSWLGEDSGGALVEEPFQHRHKDQGPAGLDFEGDILAEETARPEPQDPRPYMHEKSTTVDFLPAADGEACCAACARGESCQGSCQAHVSDDCPDGQCDALEHQWKALSQRVDQAYADLEQAHQTKALRDNMDALQGTYTPAAELEGELQRCRKAVDYAEQARLSWQEKALAHDACATCPELPFCPREQ